MVSYNYPSTDVICEGVCPETEIVVYSVKVRIYYSHVRSDGDGWNTPHIPAHYEFQDATIDGVPVTGMMREWALAWFDANQIGVYDRESAA